MMKTLPALLLAVALLFAPGTGQCQESTQPAASQTWYGYQTLLADSLLFATIVGAATSDSAPVAIAGVGAYFVASPVIHSLNHQPNNLGLSVLFRLALPLAGFAIGSGRADCHDSEEESLCTFGQGLVGFGIGMIAATVIDAALAWKTNPASPDNQPAAPRVVAPAQSRTYFSMSSVRVVPTPNGASLVVGGQF
jgi:hypothetical protein